jgi:hypothetical protein
MRPTSRSLALKAFAAAHGLPLLLGVQLAYASSTLAGGAGPVAKAYLDFSIGVPKVMQLRLVGHPLALDVTAADVARGEITVSGPALDLLVNNPLGYVLRAEILGAVFTAVRINGLAAPVVVTHDAALLRMPTMVGRPKPAPTPVEYRLQLAADALPGRYAWPVSLTIQEP